jgi:diketogulonate reductase-like aldo/keto reductase
MTIPASDDLPTQVTLPSGDRMPVLGLGCWQAPADKLAAAVEHAIRVGYRHIDGAKIYGNEEALGEGIRRSGVPREELWVTTKLWNSECSVGDPTQLARVPNAISMLILAADHRPEDVLAACKESLAKLGLDYLDLWLMHYPAAHEPKGWPEEIKLIDVSCVDKYKAMEACVDAGLVRNIGISSGCYSGELSDAY